MITGITLQHKDVLAEDSWKKSLANAFRDPVKLLKQLGLVENKYLKQISDPDQFKLLVPESYVKKIEHGNWHDPLLKQVLPLHDESVITSGFSLDPVGDLTSEVSSGLLHKYHGRVLLITTGACAVHCRYCFRQHFPYGDSIADKKNWQLTFDSIKNDKSIKEVILSGGDPLMLSDTRLKDICFALAELPHVKTIRFHSRIPIFLPERINKKFIDWTSCLPLQKVMVIHSNHANELDDATETSLDELAQAGFTLLNQSVLLKGINDDVESLVQLSEKLFSMKVLPYYLHELDKVQGAAHFKVDKAEALTLMSALKNVLPGYLVPKYVKEVSGERCKQSVV